MPQLTGVDARGFRLLVAWDLGGTVYDALIAADARHHGLTLVTSDGRARRTYAGLQADHLVL